MMARTAKQQTLLWAEVKHRLRLLLPGVLAGALLLGLIAYMIIGPQMYFRDTAGQRLKQGRGVITSITYSVYSQDGKVSDDKVFIAMDNSSETYIYTNKAERLLQKGQHVQINYRVGKSGRVYVEDIESVREAKP